MNRQASVKKVARRYIIAGVLTPILEEVLPNTFSKIPAEDRALMCEKCLGALRSLQQVNPRSVAQAIYAETQVPDTFILTDVGHLFSDVGSAEKEKLLSLLSF
jgi:hypothetical protein